jgi:hypothetical protein
VSVPRLRFVFSHRFFVLLGFNGRLIRLFGFNRRFSVSFGFNHRFFVFFAVKRCCPPTPSTVGSSFCSTSTLVFFHFKPRVLVFFASSGPFVILSPSDNGRPVLISFKGRLLAFFRFKACFGPLLLFLWRVFLSPYSNLR